MILEALSGGLRRGGKRPISPSKKFLKNFEKTIDETAKRLYNTYCSLRLTPTNKQLNKMESWLSGRRRTIGNRVGVMSVSRVQIPNSPPKVS